MLDADGHNTTDPVEALKGVVSPIGGPKGSGIAMMMNIFGGLLTGSASAGDVKDQFSDFENPQTTADKKKGLYSDSNLRPRQKSKRKAPPYRRSMGGGKGNSSRRIGLAFLSKRVAPGRAKSWGLTSPYHLFALLREATIFLPLILVGL